MKQNPNTQTTVWSRPQDFVSIRTSDPKKMLGKYLASRVMKTYTEDFVDEDTGETVSIERNEILFERGKKLTKDLIQKIMFSIQAGEIKDVEVTGETFLKAERFIPKSMISYVVVLHSNARDLSVVVRAQNIETAIQVAIDFTNVYRELGEYFSVVKVNPMCCIIVDDDDDCIPEDERQPLQDKKTYYKVSTRLFYKATSGKWKNEDKNYLITADEVGQAKDRVFRLGMELNRGILAEDPNNSFKVRRAIPFECEALVPMEYSELYRIEHNI